METQIESSSPLHLVVLSIPFPKGAYVSAPITWMMMDALYYDISNNATHEGFIFTEITISETEWGNQFSSVIQSPQAAR